MAISITLNDSEIETIVKEELRVALIRLANDVAVRRAVETTPTEARAVGAVRALAHQIIARRMDATRQNEIEVSSQIQAASPRSKGAVLDSLGAIVSEARGGRSDDDYRTAINSAAALSGQSFHKELGDAVIGAIDAVIAAGSNHTADIVAAVVADLADGSAVTRDKLIPADPVARTI